MQYHGRAGLSHSHWVACVGSPRTRSCHTEVQQLHQQSLQKMTSKMVYKPMQSIGSALKPLSLGLAAARALTILIIFLQPSSSRYVHAPRSLERRQAQPSCAYLSRPPSPPPRALPPLPSLPHSSACRRRVLHRPRVVNGICTAHPAARNGGAPRSVRPLALACGVAGCDSAAVTPQSSALRRGERGGKRM